MEKGSERRTSERNPFKRHLSLEVKVTQPGRVRNVLQDGLAVDISKTGLGLSTEGGLNEGEVVKLLLSLDEGKISLPVLARVMWSKSARGSFRAGLQFLA